MVGGGGEDRVWGGWWGGKAWFKRYNEKNEGLP